MSRGYAMVGLVRPKNTHNIGHVLRAAGCYGVPAVVIQWRGKVRAPTDTQKCFRHLPIFRAEDVLQYLPYDCVPIAVEVSEDAEPLPRFHHPERAFYVFGPEDGSIPPETMECCARVVTIPTRHCLNLAAAVNVVLYDRLAKQMKGKIP